MPHHQHQAPTDRQGPHGGRRTAIDTPAARSATDRSQPSGRAAILVGRPGVWAGLWSAVTAVIATIAGITPHVLHHLGLFAGAFLITGAAGNLLFGVLGLLLSIPLLRRLHRRFGTWKVPAIAVGVFAVMFSVSAFVIGPAVSGSDEPPAPAPSQGVSPDDHAGHHE